MKNNPLSAFAKKLGSLGGKKSVAVRFKGKSKSEISEIMRKVRVTKEDQEHIKRIGNETLEAIRKIED